jgi:hypothetical protein
MGLPDGATPNPYEPPRAAPSELAPTGPHASLTELLVSLCIVLFLVVLLLHTLEPDRGPERQPRPVGPSPLGK